MSYLFLVLANEMSGKVGYLQGSHGLISCRGRPGPHPVNVAGSPLTSRFEGNVIQHSSVRHLVCDSSLTLLLQNIP